MGRVSDYAFINAKLRARIGQMHSSSLINDMIKAPTLNEAISLLKDTKHSSLVSVYQKTGDIQQVELSLLEDEIATFKEVASYLKGKEASLVSVLLEKTEEENIKSALRLWYSSQIRGVGTNYRAQYIFKQRIVHPVNYELLINARGYEDVKSAFKDTVYESLFNSISFDEIKSSGLFWVEIKIDHLYYDRLFAAIDTLSGEDRKISRDIYNVDVDLKNILSLSRYIFYHHLDSEQLKAVIIPYSKVYEDLKAKKVFDKDFDVDELRAVLSKNYKSVMKTLSDIRKDEDDLTDSDEIASDILQMENYLSETRRKEFLKILTSSPFNIGIILSYLFLLRDEDRMLRSILNAKFYKWDEETIRKRVL